MNRSEEDYIKTIYELSINNNDELVKTNEIAEALGFTDQSVNEMIKKLSKKGFLSFFPYKGISLTEKGNKEAVRMIRAHRIWEVFLMKNLDYRWNEVHDIAEQLEHIGNDDFINRLFNYIGSPEYCSHGNPIPTENGTIKNTPYTKSLSEFEVNDIFVLKRVLDNKNLLIYLNEKNININDLIKIIEKDDYSGYIKVLINNKEHIFTNKVTKSIYGEKK